MSRWINVGKASYIREKSKTVIEVTSFISDMTVGQPKIAIIKVDSLYGINPEKPIDLDAIQEKISKFILNDFVTLQTSVILVIFTSFNIKYVCKARYPYSIRDNNIIYLDGISHLHNGEYNEDYELSRAYMLQKIK